MQPPRPRGGAKAGPPRIGHAQSPHAPLRNGARTGPCFRRSTRPAAPSGGPPKMVTFRSPPNAAMFLCTTSAPRGSPTRPGCPRRCGRIRRRPGCEEPERPEEALLYPGSARGRGPHRRCGEQAPSVPPPKIRPSPDGARWRAPRRSTASRWSPASRACPPTVQASPAFGWMQTLPKRRQAARRPTSPLAASASIAAHRQAARRTECRGTHARRRENSSPRR